MPVMLADTFLNFGRRGGYIICRAIPEEVHQNASAKRKKCEANLQHLKERLYDFLRHLQPSLAVL